MKIIHSFVFLIAVISISSCAVKVPTPDDSSKGIMALSVKATNSTVSKSNFGFYFKIFSSLEPDKIITIYPEVGETFVFSEELSPGVYYFDKIKNILDMQVGRASSNSSVSSISTIRVTIKPGAVTIADKRLLISAKRTSPEQYQMRWDVKDIPSSEMKELTRRFQQLENSNKWSIANDH